MKGSTHDFLGVPQSVYSGRVDPVDASLERVTDAGDRGRIVLGTPTEGPSSPARGPSAESDSAEVKIAIAEAPSREDRYCLCHVRLPGSGENMRS